MRRLGLASWLARPDACREGDERQRAVTYAHGESAGVPLKLLQRRNSGAWVQSSLRAWASKCMALLLL